MLNTEWQLSGSIAERYEEHLVPVIFAPWAKDLLARADVSKGQSLLDLACGTGIVARRAAMQGVTATGGDINLGMLAVARKYVKELDVTFVEADAQALPFEDQQFDVVICQQGLQFFPDKATAVKECFRVLKPRGKAIFCTAREVGENPLMQAQIEAFSRHIGDEAANPIRAVCGFPDPSETQSLFEAAGFEQVKVEKVVLSLFAGKGGAFVDGLLKATPVADKIANMEQSDRNQVRDAMLDAFADCFDGAALRFPHSANVVVAGRAK